MRWKQASAPIAGKAWLEALVLAILIGTAIRSMWTPGDRWHDGIAFSAKYLLEVAVVLLGASVSAATILAAGVPLLVGIAGVVASAILLSFGIGRLLGLPTRMALLVACGNSICGNSAIAAVAPVIEADSDDVAASIAFTAVLGVVVVLGLPLLGIALGNERHRFRGAGRTDRVRSAAGDCGRLATGGCGGADGNAGQARPCADAGAGLPRPVADRAAPCPARAASGEVVAGTAAPRKFDLAHLVPWFIVGFLVMVACRSFGLVPTAAIAPIGRIATLLTVVSMAALGLGVDVRTVAKAGGKVTTAVVLSLLGLGAISMSLLALLHIA